MPFILLPSGLQTQSVEEIEQDFQEKFAATFGVNTNTAPDSFLGRFIKIISEVGALYQEVALDVYSSFDPDAAEGRFLDQRASLTGSIRRGESFSEVNGEVAASGPINIPDGALIRNADTGTQWQLINGPLVQPGAGSYPATFQAVDAGPLIGNAGTTWELITVVANWTGFTNPIDDATLGALEESDVDFRQRRGVELYSQNVGPLLAISGAVSKVNSESGRVVNVRTYHNPSIAPADSDGIPFKAFNVVVETEPPLPLPQPPGPISGLAQEIADAIFSVTGAGGESHGTDYGVVEEISVIDAEGEFQGPIKFDVFRDIVVYVDISITTSNEVPLTPEDGQTFIELIQTTCATFATQNYEIFGRDALAFDFVSIVNQLQFSGQITGVAACTAGVSRVNPNPGPALTDQIEPIGIRERADYNSGAIRVFIDGVTP